MKRFPLRSVYVLTDPHLSRGRSHEEVVREAIRGGAEIVQLRDKAATTRELVEVGLRLREITAEAGVLLIVNDRVDVALAVEADGVHLGPDDMHVGLAKRLMGDRIVGVSVDDDREAMEAVREGADYVSIGPVFPTSTKPDAGPAVGVEMVRRVREAVGVPVVAIGGINARNAREVIEAGADCVAVISAVVSAPDIRSAVEELVKAVKEARYDRGDRKG